MNNVINKSYKVGLYIRLSREDGDDLESESITNQRSLLNYYAQENNFYVYDEYVDDGFSGCNFDRPAFKRMIKDIENCNINCVITKDLSRLGRDFIETGRYIERYFPEHNVRYIAKNDDIDTLKNSNDDLMPFRLGINDMYARDISKKVRSALLIKKQKGEYCGSHAPYGYKKSPGDKHVLIPDPVYSKVVKRIFKLYISGTSSSKIAEILTKEGVPTPIMVKYKHMVPDKEYHPEIWKHTSVTNILGNEVYTGSLVQHKMQNINCKSKKRIKVPKEEQCIVKGAHEAIVTKEEFELAKSIKNRSNNYNSSRRSVDYLFSNKVFCKDCNSRMSISYDKKRDRVTMNCNNYRKFSKYDLCFSHYINYEKLERTVFDKIKKLLSNYDDKESLKSILLRDYSDPKEETKRKIKVCNLEIEKQRQKQDSLYDDKFNGLISPDTYKRLFNECELKIEKLNSKLVILKNELLNIKEDINKKEVFENAVTDFLKCKNPTKEMINKIIDKIYVTSDKTLEIHYQIGNENKIY